MKPAAHFNVGEKKRGEESEWCPERYGSDQLIPPRRGDDPEFGAESDGKRRASRQ